MKDYTLLLSILGKIQDGPKEEGKPNDLTSFLKSIPSEELCELAALVHERGFHQFLLMTHNIRCAFCVHMRAEVQPKGIVFACELGRVLKRGCAQSLGLWNAHCSVDCKGLLHAELDKAESEA